MTTKELQQICFEEESNSFGSLQMIKFGFGILYATHGFDIPAEYYPLPTSKYLGEMYRNSKAPLWMLRLWASNSMIQLHQSAMESMNVTFNLWFPEKLLHQEIETFCSTVFVTQGVTFGDPSRCTQCGKLMAENTICAPCWRIYAPLIGLSHKLEEWSIEKKLKIDYHSIWKDFEEYA